MRTRFKSCFSAAGGHSFRRMLPPEAVAPLPDLRQRNDSDVKLFLLSFAAFFTAFYTFIF
jgi:hypothetical protein